MSKLSPHELGAFLREQRQSAQLSLRQLSDLAGVSNPYLSQIERGLKKPSAEILQQLARALQVSAESLYVHAGILDAVPAPAGTPGVLEAIAADPALTPRQRAVLTDVYVSFVGTPADPVAAEPRDTPDVAPDEAPEDPTDPGPARPPRSAPSRRRTSTARPTR